MIVVALLATSIFAVAQSTVQLQIDKNVRVGKLPNGLTYYIRHNQEPKDLAYFYIAQKVGAIQENKDQRGLAHFLEHMCFNGTSHFPGTSLRSYLEKIGVKFGADLNAYTAVDETVYNIDNVPVKTAGAIDSCLWILHDWSNDLTLDSKEIDDERGVIQEEWRMRNSANQRLMEKSMPVIMANSKYADCMPIGSMDIVKNFKPQTLRDYYEKWYRPDLQGIIVVGDINVDEIEKKIKKIFADIPAAPADAAKREYYTVPDNKQPIIFIGKDKEYTSPVMTVYFKHDATSREQNNTELHLINSLLDGQIDYLFHSRTTEITQTANTPFDWCTGKNGGYFLARSKEAFQLNIMTKNKKGATERGFRAAMDELNRLRQYGFTKEEWQRSKAELETNLETMYNQREKHYSSSYVDDYVRNFLDNTPAISIETNYNILKQALSKLTVDDINKRFQSYFKDNDENIVMTYYGVDNDTIQTPTKDDMWRWYKEQEGKKLEPYKDVMAGLKLLPSEPTPGKIVSRTKDNKTGDIKLVLSNGANVVIKKTDFQKDKISMSALARGGMSLFPEEMYKYGGLLNTSLSVMGKGNLNWSQLQKYLAGVNASASAGIGDNISSVTGSCSPKFFSNMMELVYASFLYPNNDQQAFKALLAKLVANTRESKNLPGHAYGQAVSFALYGENGYTADLTPTELEQADYGKLLELYKQRFSDASGFTFFFMGDVDEKAMAPYIEKYIASLPSSYRKEDCKPIKDVRKGIFETYLEEKQQTPTAKIMMRYATNSDYTLKNYLLSAILGQIMNIVYTKTIREDAGAAYSVGCGGDTHMYPSKSSRLEIQFTTQPEKKDLAVSLVKKGLEDVAKNGPRQEDLNKVKEYLQKVLVGNRKVNDYWIYIQQQEWFTGLNLDRGYDETLNSITVDDVKQLANEMLNQRNFIQVVMSSPIQKK